MDAIFGRFDLDDRPLPPGALRRAMQVVSQRPHDRLTAQAGSPGGVISPSLALGHRRRHVTGDPVEHPFPLICRDWNLALTADLRLDNREELIGLLEDSGARVAGVSDEALVLHAYRRWGADCVSRLDGDFAFALWDAGARRLFCARDFIGARPFYYSLIDRRFGFASDLETMLAFDGAERRLDLEQVRTQLSARLFWDHPERTSFGSIRRLPPGHTLTVSDAGLQLRRWWTADASGESPARSVGEWAEGLRAVVTRAIGDRMRGTPHIGAHCSGGLDSSATTILAARIARSSGRVVTAVSWSPPPDGAPIAGDERVLVECVRRVADVPVIYSALTPADVVDALTIDVTVRPFDTLENEWVTSRAAATHGVGTILSGWGGDELIAYSGIGHLASLMRRGSVGSVLSHLLSATTTRGHVPWRSLQREAALLLPDRRSRAASGDNSAGLPEYLHADLARALAGVQPLSAPYTDRQRVGVRSAQLTLLGFGHLTRRLESWADHGARLGVSYAFPLLDRRVVDYALAVPEHLFCQDGWSRYLFRYAMEGVLPDTVRWNTAKGDPALLRHVRATRRQAASGIRAALFERANRDVVVPEAMMPTLDRMVNPSGRADARARTALKGFWLAFASNVCW